MGVNEEIFRWMERKNSRLSVYSIVFRMYLGESMKKQVEEVKRGITGTTEAPG